MGLTCCLVWASATYGHDQGRPVTFAHIKPSQLLDVQLDHPGSTPCAHDFVQAARPEDIRLLPDGHGGGEHAAAIKSGHSPHSAGQLLGYGSSASWQSMKFYHEAQGLETDITDTTVMAGRSASSIRSFLTDKLVPSAIAWFERTLSVRPVGSRNLLFTPSCAVYGQSPCQALTVSEPCGGVATFPAQLLDSVTVCTGPGG